MIVSWPTIKNFINTRNVPLQCVNDGGMYYLSAADGFFKLDCTLLQSNPNDELADFTTNYLAGCNRCPIVTKPFADPDYRTKLQASAEPVVCQPNSTANIDFTVPYELWIFGGDGLVVNSEPGDWFDCCVVDANGLIPEPYRAALCEPSPGYPVISTYVPKQWVLVPGAGQNAVFRINTYPLIAKITQGLVIRVVYTAVNAGNPRTVYANYYSTVKL